MGESSYKEKYRCKWIQACSSNTATTDGNAIMLNWYGITVAEISTGSNSDVFNQIYMFPGNVDAAVEKLPNADGAFKSLVNDVRELDAIVQMYEYVQCDGNEIWLMSGGKRYGRIVFSMGRVTFYINYGNGEESTRNLLDLKRYATYIKNASIEASTIDDSLMIASLGKNVVV